MSEGAVVITPAIARCHQHQVPVVDAAGRALSDDAEVITRRDHLAGTVVHLFDFADSHPPEVEVRIGQSIFTFASRLTGGCWQFPTLLLSSQPTGADER